MFTVYAIDRDGHEHGGSGTSGGDCATLEEAMQWLGEILHEGELFEGDPDNPGALFVRYGITFKDEGYADLMDRCARPASQPACAP